MMPKAHAIAAPIRLLACLLLSVLAACGNAPPVKDADAAVTFVIVRHAEKSSDDPRDPSLSEIGKARAQGLARLLADTPLSAAYATGFRRTQQTAQPTADAHDVKIEIYDAKLPATALASQLRKAHAHGTVLVVGHSNTVPEIVATLSGTVVPAMADDEFDRLYRIDLTANGETTLLQERY